MGFLTTKNQIGFQEKENNQWFGKSFELAIVKTANNEKPVNLFPSKISEKDNEELYKDASICLNQLKNILGENHKYYWIGNETHSESADISIDNIRYEVKYVEYAAGTYLNSSLYNIQTYIPTFNPQLYMAKFGLYKALTKIRNISVSSSNKNPVSAAESSYVRKNHKEYYENTIVPIDLAMRRQMTADIVKYFREHPKITEKFVTDCLTKNLSKKKNPDNLIIFNYKKKITKIFTKDDILNMADIENIRETEQGFHIGPLRFAVAWQGGSGLNNLTLRVFIQ